MCGVNGRTKWAAQPKKNKKIPLLLGLFYVFFLKQCVCGGVCGGVCGKWGLRPKMEPKWGKNSPIWGQKWGLRPKNRRKGVKYTENWRMRDRRQF